MNTLIVFATKYGCTEKCAKILAEKLQGKVDLCNLKEVKDIELSQYAKVIIGGSVYMGKIQTEVGEFCLKNLESLRKKAIGLFTCGMQEDEKAQVQLNTSFPQELLTIAIAKDSFGGEFVFKKMKPLERFIVKMVAKMDKSASAIDTKKDISTISTESITRFAEQMNNA